MFFQKEKAKKVIFSVVRDLYWRDIKAILKSNNLQYNTYASLLGWWDKQLVDQASDVPGIIFFHDSLQNSLQKLFQIIFFIFG